MTKMHKYSTKKIYRLSQSGGKVSECALDLEIAVLVSLADRFQFLK